MTCQQQGLQRGHRGDAENTVQCGHFWGITFPTLTTLGASFTGSIIGCCAVRCCGNDEVDGKGDSAIGSI